MRQYLYKMTLKQITLLFSILLLLSACSTEKSEFVKTNGNSFELNGETFFPLTLNYIAHFRDINDKLTLAPTIEYDKLNEYDSHTEEEINKRLNAHFHLISKMGFNSIRLVGLNTINYEKLYPNAALSVYGANGKEDYFAIPQNIERVLQELHKVVQLAKENNLKVMLLLPRPRKQEHYDYNRKEYITEILKSFSKEPAIFAYDFFNEPLYFDNYEFTDFADVQRRKENVYRLVNDWSALMKKYASEQLFTIGFAEPIEAFEWDPTILPVDFVTFHTYNPLRVPNEIYWYANNINIPWMIGETSLPADNDSISYLDQAIFMKEALERTINCGGAGFGWWQFQDVSWGPFEHNFTSLLNHEGYTLLETGDTIFGSVKDAGNVLTTIKIEKNGKCDCWVNYYNMLGYKNYRIQGIVLDKSGKPIKDAVIRGWSKDWSIGANTFSKANGKFHLYSNTEFVNFEISAPGMNTEKFYKFLVYKSTKDSDSTLIEDELLEYHDINYKNYLSKDTLDSPVFGFQDDLFNQFKFEATMSPTFLSKVVLEY